MDFITDAGSQKQCLVMNRKYISRVLQLELHHVHEDNGSFHLEP